MRAQQSSLNDSILPENLALLDKELIQKRVDNKNIDIQVFKDIETTHDFKNFSDESKTFAICLAEQQTRGKGRMGRSWHSPFGQNVYFTCLYVFEKNINQLSGLSLAVSLAVIKTLKKYDFPQFPLIKWPNDVIYQNQKLSGILIDIKPKKNHICHAMISIGINVNMIKDKDDHQDENILQPWTSVREILGSHIDRNDLCAELINHLREYLKKFERSGLDFFMSEWKSVDLLLDKPITLNNAGHKISGIAKGINSQGHLLLELKSSELQAFSSGDTSVLKNKNLII